MSCSIFLDIVRCTTFKKIFKLWFMRLIQFCCCVVAKVNTSQYSGLARYLEEFLYDVKHNFIYNYF